MVTTGAINYGDNHRFLQYNDGENPLALQLGGSDPKELVKAIRIASPYQYDEYNLNLGCPSDRVQAGLFGACLMMHAKRVGECISAMQSETEIPITVKTRIGVDKNDSYEFFRDFIAHLADCGCRVFIIHARKAWLKGLSPKENREIPPLQYDYVSRLKKEMPELSVIVNGGIKDIDTGIMEHKLLDGVMLGRQAYSDPFMFLNVDQQYYSCHEPSSSKRDVVMQYAKYALHQSQQGVPWHILIKHVLGLYQGCKGAKAWRRYLSQFNSKNIAQESVFEDALSLIEMQD